MWTWEGMWKRFCVLFSIVQSPLICGRPSTRQKGFLSLTCHAIEGEWVLRNMVLNTREVPVDHTAENVSDTLKEMTIQWNIKDKVVGSSKDNGKNVINAVGIFQYTLCWTHTSIVCAEVFSAGCSFKDVKQVVKYCRTLSQIKQSNNQTAWETVTVWIACPQASEWLCYKMGKHICNAKAVHWAAESHLCCVLRRHLMSTTQ